MLVGTFNRDCENFADGSFEALVMISVTRLTVRMVMPQERIQRKDRSKMTLLLIHLSVADLTVSKYDTSNM